jgi:hypothetical protein
VDFYCQALEFCIEEHASARKSTPIHTKARQCTQEHVNARQSTPVALQLESIRVKNRNSSWIAFLKTQFELNMNWFKLPKTQFESIRMEFESIRMEFESIRMKSRKILKIHFFN